MSTRGPTPVRPARGWSLRIVDHTRDEHERVRARLLDLVPGRSGAAYADWLVERGEAFTGGIRTATLDPFHGYANAIRDEPPEAFPVLDAFHAGLARRADGGRGPPRRCSFDTRGHRGRAGDPLFRVRRTGAYRGRAPHREAAPPAEHQAGGRGPAPRGHPGMALLPEAAGHLPRPPRNRPPARGRGRGCVPDLPDPRGRPAREDPAPVEGGDPGLLRHRRGLERTHRGRERGHRNHAADRPRLEATSPTTGCAASWQPAATAPTEPISNHA
nr:transposase [Kocuria dechangensis]